MAFVRIEDLSGNVELVVFPEPFSKHEMQLKSDQPVLVAGKLEKDGESVKIMVDRVGVLAEVLKKSKQMIFKIDGSMTEHLPRLNTLLMKHPGMTNVELEIEVPELKKTVTMSVTEPTGIDPSGDFFEGLHGLFGRTDFVEVRG
jgi:DNA polymerase-3 subunit alpha